MWIDVLAAAVLVLLVALGALRGALAAGLALASLVGAYAAALLLAPVLGPATGEALGLPSILGAAAAGGVVFVAAMLGFGLASALIGFAERRRRGGEPRSGGDRFLGACFGALRGGLLALLLGVLGYWLQAFEAVAGPGGLPTAGGSAVASLSQSVVEGAATAFVADDTAAGRLAVRAIAHPAETFGALQALLEDARVQALRDDGAFWLAVEAGEVDAALNRVSFLAITYNGDLRERFAEMGAVDLETAADPLLFRDAMAGALEGVGPRLRALREDPEFQRLAADPEVALLVRSGNTLALLRHPGFRRLVDRVTAS